jgi:lipoprotein-anchoring transpeptidase ErfK/SrfK
MGKKKRRRISLVITLFVLFLASVTVILFATADRPPIDTINLARENLGKARNAEAGEYSRELLQEAEGLYQQAMLEWKVQNQKWFLMRDFERLSVLMQEAADKAEEAYNGSLSLKDSLHHDLAETLHYVQERLKNYEKNYAGLPLNQQSRTDYGTAKMLYLESKEAYERGNYNGVGPKIEKSRELIVKAIAKAHGLLEEYFDDLSRWKRWSGETIEWSRKNSSTAIVVDKFARKCYVYRNGTLKKTFEAELGPNWIGTKMHKGDKATPEGKYHVTKKKRNAQTKYYKALLINYPNKEDQARYDREVKSGRISKRTGIGNLIEIHGDGGRGMDWTDGCVALSNKDMDVLYDMAAVGTPVTIVGSLKSLDEVNGF